jgi:hypothetical protein
MHFSSTKLPFARFSVRLARHVQNIPVRSVCPGERRRGLIGMVPLRSASLKEHESRSTAVVRPAFPLCCVNFRPFSA